MRMTRIAEVPWISMVLSPKDCVFKLGPRAGHSAPPQPNPSPPLLSLRPQQWHHASSAFASLGFSSDHFQLQKSWAVNTFSYVSQLLQYRINNNPRTLPKMLPYPDPALTLAALKAFQTEAADDSTVSAYSQADCPNYVAYKHQTCMSHSSEL